MNVKYMWVWLVFLGLVDGCDKREPELKWIMPPDTICKKNGGYIDNDGYCVANWKNSKKICSATGGRLATNDEYIKVIIDCGGEITDYIADSISEEDNIAEADTIALEERNRNNASYQSCRKKKGFVSLSYWSSNEVVGNSTGAWGFLPSLGFIADDAKRFKDNVVCVRAEE